MGLQFAGTSSSADAPDIEAGIYPARFDGVKAKTLEKSQFDPNVYEWAFTILDETGAVVYDDGDPIEVTGLTSRSFNVVSKTTPRAVRYLKALMTPEEFAIFSAGQKVDESALVGRKVQVLLITNDSGWPKVDDVIAVARKATKIKPAAADAE